MTKNEKAWYSLEEAAEELKIDIGKLTRKLVFLSFDEPISLPGKKEKYISSSDFRELQSIISPIERAHKR